MNFDLLPGPHQSDRMIGGRWLVLKREGEFMTSDHFDEVLQGLSNRQPFRLFTVELQSGQRFEVDHPKALVVRDGVAVFMAPGGIPVWFDHESVGQIIGASSDAAI